jgi:hypothetical protein
MGGTFIGIRENSILGMRNLKINFPIKILLMDFYTPEDIFATVDFSQCKL